MYKGRKSKLILLFLVLSMSLMACASNSGNKLIDGETVIGIVQFAEHIALDHAREGFIEELKELGINAKIIYKNAKGDVSTALNVSEEFVEDKVDLIYAIGTSAAQSAKQSTDKIPILFSAVSDPVKAGIVDDWDNVGGNITGTSDAAPIASQLKMFKKIDPDIKTIGILYNTDELNSIIEIDNVEDLAPDEGLEVVTIGINNIKDIHQGLDSLISQVDGVYCISDNMIASSVELVSKKLIENNMISVSAGESQVLGGILITDGSNYTELGEQTAKMARKILINGRAPKDISVEAGKNTNKIFNEETLRALRLDGNNKIFKDAIKVN